MGKIVIHNAPVEIVLDEVVCGSAMRLGLYLEEVGEDAFATYSTDSASFAGEVRRTHDAAVKDADLTIAPRAGAPGWIDVVLDGATTLALGEWDYVASVKTWLNGHPDDAITICTIKLPLRLRATR